MSVPTILALDLGTHTGFAYRSPMGDLHAGTWDLATPKEVAAWGEVRLDRRCDPRVFRLIEKAAGYGIPDFVVFEDVQFVQYTMQGQLWASLRAAVWLQYGRRQNRICRIECVPVTTLKKFATGHGGATKAMMSNHLKKRFPEQWRACYDDNAIDALWLLKWTEHNLTRTAR